MDITAVIEAFQNGSDAITTLTAAATGGAQETFSDYGAIRLGAFIGAGLALVGASGVGAGQGYAAGAAALAVSRNPEVKSQIMSTMIVGMAIAESAAIYGLIVAILLIFVAPTM